MFVKHFRSSASSLGRVTSRYIASASNNPLVGHSQPESAISQRKPPKDPFAKNLFVGVYDKDILSYPEVLNREQLSLLDEKVVKIREVSQDLNDADTFKGFITCWNQIIDSKVEENVATESTRLSEEISDPTFSLLMQIHEICITEALQKYGTSEQKRQFLLEDKTKLLAYALCEENIGSDPIVLNTTASQIAPNKWILNGEKILVANSSNAEYFLVFCKIEAKENPELNEKITTFLLDRNSSGVSVEETPFKALKGCGIGKLKLNDVELSSDDLIGAPGNGFDLSVSFLNHHKFFLASGYSVQIKNLLHSTVKYLKKRTKSRMDLKDSEIIQRHLAEVASVIYTLDQMRYLIAGLMDSYDVDTSLESAILQAYATEKGVQIAEKCSNLLSANLFDQSSTFTELIQNLKAIACSLNTPEINKLYITMTGLQYAGGKLMNDVKQQRNPFSFPGLVMKKMIEQRYQMHDNPKLHLSLFENLHPALKPSADQLEYCVLRLQFAVESMLVQHGAEITNRHLICLKISEVLIDIFSMTAVLSRASYAYCTGVQHCDKEVLMARCVCHRGFERCKKTLNELLNDFTHSNDVMFLKIGEAVLNEDGYFFAHPLDYNIR